MERTQIKMANRKQYVERPAVAIGANESRIFFGQLAEDHWLRTAGAALERVVEDGNGDVRITLRKDENGRKVVSYGADGSEWLLRYNNISASKMMEGIPRFNAARAVAQLLGDRLLVTVPAEDRPAYKPQKPSRTKKKAQAATALATFKEAVSHMATGSPPPNFKPAVPLREAIDTINAYVLEEGDALKLSVSKRGRLKVEYAYGG
jgi:hypothetical protein